MKGNELLCIVGVVAAEAPPDHFSSYPMKAMAFMEFLRRSVPIFFRPVCGA